MSYNFDVIQYLNDRDIPFDRGGKNIGKGWVGIQCPFQHCYDSSKHMGINIRTAMFHCWICGESGNIIKLIKVIEDCTWSEAKLRLSQYQTFFDNEEDIRGKYKKIEDIENTSKIHDKRKCCLPSECIDLMPMHKKYLISRGFDADKLIKEYHLKAVYNVGRYRGRIIIPCYLDNRLVSYLTRDVTGTSEYPYIDCKEEEAIIPVKHTLYNIDNTSRVAILVEGVTDVWRLGKSAIASFTSNMTDEQKILLIRKGIKKLFVMYDQDASKKASKLAKDLGAIIDTELILLDKGDPCDLSPDEVRQIRKDLLKE